MKKEYVTPMTRAEMFFANEFCSACGETNRIYKFECNAGIRRNSYHVYLDGPDGQPYTTDDIDWSARSGRLKTYSLCGEKHEASVAEEFPKEYMYKVNSRGSNEGESYCS